jgi:iron complex transport system ATP-binding protein
MSLRAQDLSVAYDQRTVIRDLNLEIPAGQVTAIVGPNACGKSTLLRALARLLAPTAGAVLLDGEEIHRMRTKEVARRLGLLPQQPVAPEGLSVEDLVGRGRYPHQRFMQQFSDEDEAQIEWALEVTATTPLRRRPLDELSGGQRQRVWIAMALAQDTGVLLLDEPTTFLDLAHQVDVLELVSELNEGSGKTIVLVLHDLNQACRYAHHLIALKDGEVWARGNPADVISAELVESVFGLRVAVVPDPVEGTPMCVPIGRVGRRMADLGAAGEPATPAPADREDGTPRDADDDRTAQPPAAS